jgi:hypothetical protein
VKRASLGLALALLGLAALLMILSALPQHWLKPAPEPPEPLMVSASVTPSEARAHALPKSARLSPDGRLTILDAPGTEGTPVPREEAIQAPEPLDAQPLPASMAAGIRALFGVVPPREDRRDRLVFRNLERIVQQGRLLLVDGCLRFASPRGPHAVLPYGTRLGLADGYLVAGPPGWPRLQSARVGEELFWEGRRVPITHEASLQLIARHCGPGPAIVVVPQSATVQQARNDGLAASEYQRTYGGTWADALSSVRACRRRMEQGLARDIPNQPRRLTVDNICGITPPPPVTRPEDCPPGTSLSAGLCRTPEGFVRPVPRQTG